MYYNNVLMLNVLQHSQAISIQIKCLHSILFFFQCVYSVVVMLQFHICVHSHPTFEEEQDFLPHIRGLFHL